MDNSQVPSAVQKWIWNANNVKQSKAVLSIMLIEFYKYNVCKQNYEEIDSRKVLIVGLLCAMETFSIW